MFDVGREMVADHAHDQIGLAVQEGRLLGQGVALADTVPGPQQILKVTQEFFPRDAFGDGTDDKAHAVGLDLSYDVA